MTNGQVQLWCPAKNSWFSYSQQNWICGCGGNDNSITVSILTAVKDREREFERAIESISKQSYLTTLENFNRIEHVVQDGGGSTSRKIVIEKFAKCHTTLSLLEDSSLYDGFNQAFKLSRGNLIAYLNSDDFYAIDYIKKSIAILELSNADWSFGNIIMDYGFQSVFHPGRPDYFVSPWSNFLGFHHTTIVCKREIFASIGTFKTELSGEPLDLASDYLWFLSAMKEGFCGVYSPSIIGYMKFGGVSTVNIKQSFIEGCRVAIDTYPEKKRAIRLIWSSRFVIGLYFDTARHKFPRKIAQAARVIYRQWYSRQKS